MEWLTFIIVVIIVAPMQILLFVTLYWFRNKFDRYEAIALEIIKKYTETSVHYSNKEIKFAQSHIEAPRINEPYINATADEIITAYKKLYTGAIKTHRNYIIEGGIRAIAGSLKERYRDEQFIAVIETINNKLGIELGADWVDENPLVGAGLDLLSAAWNYINTGRRG